MKTWQNFTISLFQMKLLINTSMHFEENIQEILQEKRKQNEDIRPAMKQDLECLAGKRDCKGLFAVCIEASKLQTSHLVCLVLSRDINRSIGEFLLGMVWLPPDRRTADWNLVLKTLWRYVSSNAAHKFLNVVPCQSSTERKIWQ